MTAGRSSRRQGLILSLVLLSMCLACTARRGRPVLTPGDGFRASCKGRLALGEEKVRFRGNLALLPPDGIRVEMRGPVGGTRALFVLRGGRILLLLPGTREFFEGRADRDTVGALLGVDVDAQGLLKLISSADPRRCGDVESVSGLMLECRDGMLVARFEGGTLELRLEEVERRVSIPADLFTLEVPSGWTRLVLDDGSGPGFFLRQ